ncbi:hypothetical protein H0G86_009906 [Trichoderma simmonsii]|uniref:Uncharacterized protein n=1 Tax=Trichoderma simmonsii TaxID=1491479 RepID=A0A8G0LIG2_9HYPO|nr:hypothetical protein H0G86_009906 [Trichoderma simmonsii]
MDFLTEVLKPIPVVVWGGPALEHCGVRAFIHGYIFIVNECDRDVAAAKLLNAGCVRADWSWGSTDPATLQTMDEDVQRRHRESIPEYEDIDNNSIRFVFPPESVRTMNEPIALVLPSFVKLGPPRTAALGSRQPAQEDMPRGDYLQENTPLPELGLYAEQDNLQPIKSLHNSKSLQDAKSTPEIAKVQGGEEPQEDTADDSKFTCVDDFLYYPHLPVLLESLICARLRVSEDKPSLWKSMLGVWAITYLGAQTMAPYDILDGIEDKEVKAWFNKATRRSNGGIDRVTVTKRRGRVASTRPPVDLDTLFD